MSNRPPDDLDDTGELSGTQPLTPPSTNTPSVNTSPMNTPPPNLPEWSTPPQRELRREPISPRVQQPPPPTVLAPRPERELRKRKPNDRSRNALYLPAWSVGLMLLLVFGITAAIIMLVLTLGGRTGTGGEPRVVIITAEPTGTLETQPTPAPTLEDGQVQSFGIPLPTFALEGPTLPPIILSPTPLSITIGATVIVNSESLRIRPDPSLDNTENFYANEGDRFTVIGGPQQGSGLTWWQVQDTSDPSRTGWAAADYLDVAIQ